MVPLVILPLVSMVAGRKPAALPPGHLLCRTCQAEKQCTVGLEFGPLLSVKNTLTIVKLQMIAQVF